MIQHMEESRVQPIAIKSRPASDRAPAAESFNDAFSRLFGLDDRATTEVILVRHAEPDYRAIGQGEDPRDPPLSGDGRRQALQVATRLRNTQIDAVYSSTTRRALETAAVIAAAGDLPMTQWHDLREIDIDREALRRANGDSRALAGMAIRFMNEPRWDSLPALEPSRRFRHRVIQAIEAIIACHPAQRVVVVTHGGVINAYLSMLLDIPRDMFFLPEHTSLSVVRNLRDMTTVQRLNDFAHLLPEFGLA
jgi:probable phosphoglycerate mutase